MFHIYPYPVVAAATSGQGFSAEYEERIGFEVAAAAAAAGGDDNGVTTTTTVPRPFPPLFAYDPEKPSTTADPAAAAEDCGPCPTCDAQIPPPDLIHHLRQHMGPRRCTICNYSAPTKHHLREHLNTHTGHKPYKCTYCDKSFAAKNSLRVHTMYLHTKVRQHQCRFCEQRFVTTSERKSHELVHTDKCPVCEMSFRLRGHLRQHMRVHKQQSGCRK